MTDPLVDEVFRLIAESRRERQVGLVAVARRAGVVRETVRNWRRGHSPTLRALTAVLRVLGCELRIVRLTRPADEG